MRGGGREPKSQVNTDFKHVDRHYKRHTSTDSACVHDWISYCKQAKAREAMNDGVLNHGLPWVQTGRLGPMKVHHPEGGRNNYGLKTHGNLCMYVCVCMYVCMYVCVVCSMYVCMNV